MSYIEKGEFLPPDSVMLELLGEILEQHRLIICVHKLIVEKLVQIPTIITREEKKEAQ